MDRRRAGPGERRRYNIKELWDKHREIARQVVLGGTNVSIAEAIGCTPQTVSNVRNSPLGRAEQERLHEGRDEATRDVARRIEEFVPQALSVLEDIITGRTPGASIALRAKVAGGHLARAGYGEVHRVQALHAHLSGSDIQAIKDRARSASLPQEDRQGGVHSTVRQDAVEAVYTVYAAGEGSVSSNGHDL